jgi:hypothetical protein
MLDSGLINLAPRAIYICNPEGLPILFGRSKPYPDPYPYKQFLVMIVVDPKGKIDSLGFCYVRVPSVICSDYPELTLRGLLATRK